MDDSVQPPSPRRKRSGSETRKRPVPFPVRLSLEERAMIEAAAERAGVTLGTYIRSCVLAAPATRARRRPSVEIVALAKLLATINKVGGNIHQLVRHANFGNVVFTEDLAAALADHRAVVEAIMALLGRTA